MNGRRYLDPDRLGGRAYISICQALGEFIFPDVEQYVTSKSTPDIERRKIVIRAAKVAGALYQKILERKSILSESVPLMESLAQKKFQYVLCNTSYLVPMLRPARCQDSGTTSDPTGIFPPVSPLQHLS